MESSQNEAWPRWIPIWFLNRIRASNMCGTPHAGTKALRVRLLLNLSELKTMIIDHPLAGGVMSRSQNPSGHCQVRIDIYRSTPGTGRVSGSALQMGAHFSVLHYYLQFFRLLGGDGIGCHVIFSIQDTSIRKYVVREYSLPFFRFQFGDHIQQQRGFIKQPYDVRRFFPLGTCSLHSLL